MAGGLMCAASFGALLMHPMRLVAGARAALSAAQSVSLIAFTLREINGDSATQLRGGSLKIGLAISAIGFNVFIIYSDSCVM